MSAYLFPFFLNTVCPYGYYGYDCKHACNSTCKGCDEINGLCNTGCQLGWRGVYCQEGMCIVHSYIKRLENRYYKKNDYTYIFISFVFFMSYKGINT